MILEELIAKLGFKVAGQNEAARFLRELDKIKKAAKEAGKGLNFEIKGKGSGLSRVASDAERATRALRKMREEAGRASRVRFPGYGPVGPGGGGRRPGGGSAAAGAAAGASGAGGVSLVASLGSIVAVLNRFGNLEAAQVELAKTAEKTKAEVQPDVDTFLTEGPKLGVTAKTLVNTAGAYVAAGIDYDTAIKSTLVTAQAAKAGSVEFDAAAQAAIVTIQNLGVEVGDLGKAFDIFIKGGKLGKAEFKELASSFPELAASAGKSGIKGLKGTRDLMAAMEVVREGTATTPEATTELKDLLEKIIAPDVARHFKKHGKVNLEKELVKREKGGKTRLDAFLDLLQEKTGGNEFRISEYLHEQQSRAAAVALLKNREKYEGYKGIIDREAPGTVQTDLAKSMDTFNSSVEKAGASLDRLAVRIGEFLAPGARAGLEAATAGDQARVDGKGQTSVEANAMVEKLNRLLGAPPTYHGVVGAYGGITANNFDDRFGAAVPDKRPSFMRPQSKGMTAPTFGSLGDRTNWLSQGAAKGAGTTITNTNTGNDQRAQSVHISQTVNGVPGVASAAAEGAKSGLASMGASIVKGNTASTGSSTAP